MVIPRCTIRKPAASSQALIPRGAFAVLVPSNQPEAREVARAVRGAGAAARGDSSRTRGAAAGRCNREQERSQPVAHEERPTWASDLPQGGEGGGFGSVDAR